MNQQIQAKALAQLRALNRLAGVISSSLDVRDILQAILQEAMELTEAQQGAILSFEPQEPRPLHTLFKTTGTVGTQLNSAFSDLIGGWVLKHRHHVLVKNFPEDSRFQAARKWFAHVRAVLAVPMLLQDRITGIIILTRTLPFGEDELDLIKILSAQCAQVLENAKHFQQLCHENLALRREIKRQYDYHGIIGNSPGMQRIFDLLERIIPGQARVLIEGESGTGKELIAKIIHYNGPRKEKRFIAVDCGALPENLLESELFGHVKGAFTGATGDKKGLFELAHQGTLFLDEISNTSMAFQARLLRAIQEGEIKPVGSPETRKVDVRTIAATSTRLQERVARGEFREDLYYRLNVINIFLPPLRERREDIPLLARHFLQRYSEEYDKNCRGFEASAMRLMEAYHWPGNIRELENVVERAVALAYPDDSLIHPNLLPESIAHNQLDLLREVQEKGTTLPEALEMIEQRMIAEALKAHRGNRTEAAAKLGISRQTLITKIKKYKL